MEIVKNYNENIIDFDDFKKPKIEYKEKSLPPAIKNLDKGKYEMISNETIQNMVDKFPNPATLYLYLKHNKAVWDREQFGLEKDKFDLYNEYFIRQRKICVSISERIIAKHFKVDRKTIRRWAHQLRDEGFIKIEQVKFGSGKNYKTYNIFVLGRLTQTGERGYYADIL